MPQIANSISIGNIITIVSLLFVAGMAWSDATSRIAQVSNEVVDHESRLRVIESKVGESLARIDERLASIERKLNKTVPQMVAE